MSKPLGKHPSIVSSYPTEFLQIQAMERLVTVDRTTFAEPHLPTESRQSGCATQYPSILRTAYTCQDHDEAPWPPVIKSQFHFVLLPLRSSCEIPTLPCHSSCEPSESSPHWNS